MTMRKKSTRDYRSLSFVTNAVLEMRGRKVLMDMTGMRTADSARSPLTRQLLATLNHPDSYVKIPLTDTRHKNNTVYNIKDKAKRAGAECVWALSEDGKSLYAWFTKKRSTINDQNQVESDATTDQTAV